MRILILAVGLLTGANPVQAQTPHLSIETAPLQIAPLMTVPTTPNAQTAGRPISLEELATLNGKQGETVSIAMSEQDLNAVNHGNTVSANTVASGQITIGAGAYQGFAGVGNFVINSGHNNNLQGALTINIVTP